MSILIEDLKASLSAPRNDGLLHFSQHLQHDRHTALYAEHGYPTDNPTWGRMFPLVQGTGIHETIHLHMKDICEMYAPEHPVECKRGEFTWTGTVDAFAKYDDKHWILDYKTISGAGMFFLGDEPKPEHVLQVSAYHAFKPESGINNWRTAIIYLPSSPDYKKNWEEPRMIEFEPSSRDEILQRMFEVETAILAYKYSGELPDPPAPSYAWKKRPGKSSKRTYDLMYKPHFTNLFCPWASQLDDPCGCSADKAKSVAVWNSEDELTIEEGYARIVEEIGKPE
jgi:hypothetical protein